MDVTRTFFLFLNLNPALANICKEYVKILTKCHLSVAVDKFLKSCYEEQVLPKSLLPKRLLHMNGKPFDQLEKLILKKAIKNHKFETKDLFKKKHIKILNLRRLVNVNDMKIINDHAYHQMRKTVTIRKRLHQRKLEKLISESKWEEPININNIVNLSDKVLNKTTTQALNYGLSFHINNQLDPLDIGKAFINLEKNSRIDSNNINICKGLVYSCLANNNENNIPQRFISTIKSIKNDKNIHITKADKANSIVLINKNQYLEKMNLLLSDLETYIPLNKNPLEKLNKDFNSNLRKILNTEKSEYIDKFKSRMSTLPYMYGLIKTHKQGFPIRPIISTVGSASYKLSKYLVSILTPLVGTISNSNIKNNSDLIMKLNNCKPNYEFKLVSFDVTSLFTKVPIDDLLIYLKPELEKYKETLELSPDIIIDLIKLCVLDLKFVFNEKFYKQKFGLSMGNPLSPVLSNIYMEFFEKKLINQN